MHLLIFGLGYTASRLAARLMVNGWQVTATSRTQRAGTVAIDSAAAAAAVRTATHILSSVPPVDGRDTVLDLHAAALRDAPSRWIGYLSSTGVYGDTGGAWVDEHAVLGGRRVDRIAADRAWAALRPDVRIFRLPGIYGPERSALDAVYAGTAHRVDAPGQRFSRIHVDDIGSSLIASFASGAPGIYNLADDEPAEGRAVTEYACALTGSPLPPLITPDSSLLSPMARGFYTESRVVSPFKARRAFGPVLAYRDFRAGLRAIHSGR